ncbi:MAG: tRNA (guanosine(37)-N1)-methyltransferase TrmD [Deltaproteobacteria bacterium]|nr:tRNA (guanosine(37)-N1)-methyltransferase TrmD [Deltaproteobacteria bacterium]
MVTLFPEIFSPFENASLIGKAVEKKILKFTYINLRDYSHDKHRSVDDTPYGGGAGMVIKPAPVFEMLEDVKDSYKVFLTPGGKPYTQSDAARLASLDKPLLLFCGRYEGLDERAVEEFDEQISIGDFVLNGGEVAAMAVVESVSRLLDGVIGNMDSVTEESFSSGLLEYPQYSRPEIFNGKKVPEILLSGNHKLIKEWRKGRSLLKTRKVRPDLFDKYEMSDLEKKLFEKAQKEEKDGTA